MAAVRVGVLVGRSVGADGGPTDGGPSGAVRVSVSLFASDARDDGTAPVYLTVRHSGKRALLPLAHYGVPNLRPRDWKARTSSVRKTAPHADVVGARIAECLSTAEHVAVVVSPAPALVVRDAVRDRLDEDFGLGAPEPEVEDAEPCFLAFCRDQVAGYAARGQVGTHDQYRAVVDKLEAYVSAPSSGAADTLLCKEVTAAIVRGFCAWLLAPEPAGRGNSANTARKAVTTLRTFWTRAAREGEQRPCA